MIIGMAMVGLMVETGCVITWAQDYRELFSDSGGGVWSWFGVWGVFYNQTPFCFLSNRSILMSVVDSPSSHLPSVLLVR
jgi:hypothetical protein